MGLDWIASGKMDACPNSALDAQYDKSSCPGASSG